MKFLSLAFLLLCLAAPVRACLWDTDTLAAEYGRFTDAGDVIVGNFPRHSREFHVWRKEKCEAALAKDPSQAALYDDLAVSQHKLGDHQAAIKTMEAKEKVAPGLYETLSNLGTFYIYTGDLDQAAVYIDKALAINPDAHFGREKYQRLLIDWLKAGLPQGKDDRVAFDGVPPLGFADFILQRSGEKTWSEDLRKPALAGVLGMMRFADYDNPLLLEAAGDLLSAGSFQQNASRLATVAYIFASRRSTTDAEKQRLWKKMERVGGTVADFKPRASMTSLNDALSRAVALNAKVRADEIAWIKAGKDVGAEFQKKYLIKTKNPS
jgi:hypothetical protein